MIYCSPFCWRRPQPLCCPIQAVQRLWQVWKRQYVTWP
nr:MAG TPA: hypothetical protein [Caudoviricetes sp.]